MGIIYNCWRCGKTIVTDDGKPYYSLTALEWKNRIGKTIGHVIICGECADGVDDYLDEVYKKTRIENKR